MSINGFGQSTKATNFSVSQVEGAQLDRRKPGHWLALAGLGVVTLLTGVLWMGIRTEYRRDFESQVFAESPDADSFAAAQITRFEDRVPAIAQPELQPRVNGRRTLRHHTGHATAHWFRRRARRNHDAGHRLAYIVAFELWDAELGISLGAFESEADALAVVRRLCQESDGSRAPLGLIQDGRRVLATGDALVERAMNASLSRA